MLTAKNPTRVLIVDDEHSVADTLAMILNRSGHTSKAVYSGLEAIEAARDFKPHAMLSDVMMPGMNGIELARYFAENHAQCRVLLMTAYDSALDIAQAYLPSGHFFNVLLKPVLPKTALAFVDSCGENASLMH